MEYHRPKFHQKISRELEADTKRLLFLRIFSSTFQDFHIIERTGFSFRALHPGIELAEGTGKNGGKNHGKKTGKHTGEDIDRVTIKEQVFDVLLKGNHGYDLLILHIENQNISPKRIRDRLASKIEFYRKYEDDLRKGYGIQERIHIGLLLSEREKPNIRKGLQLLGSSEDSRGFGEVEVIEFSLRDNVFHGIPSTTTEGGGRYEIPRSILLNTPSLDLMVHEYLLFEMAVLQGCYSENLMTNRRKPKEIMKKEMGIALLRELGLAKKDRSFNARIHDRRKKLALRSLDSALICALRFNLMEGEGIKLGSEEGMKQGSGSVMMKKSGEKIKQGSGDVMIQENGGGMKRVSDDGGIKNDRVGPDGQIPGSESMSRINLPANGRFRLICQGTDLSMVKKNLRRKYLEGKAGELAIPAAGKKSVEAYRRRYPRIDMKF